MACLIRLKNSEIKGVVTFTTQEHFFLKNNPGYLILFNELKKKYYVGLHFNWHNFAYQPELEYDFLMAGETDLIDRQGKPVKTLNLDACNFSPRAMDLKSSEKQWDILYVARGVFFKGVEQFFSTIRALYDSGQRCRVLFLCPAPPDSLTQTEQLIALYEKLFSLEDRKYFNFLVLRENYPFFFDLPTLSHFYRASRVFVHTAPDERRCRVAAYAFCSGLPVVGMEPVGSILSERARQNIFFEVQNAEDFLSQVLLALNSTVKIEDFTAARTELSEVYTVETLKKRLQSELKQPESFISGHWYTAQLDIRLGRHHGFGGGPNSLSYNLEGFMKTLIDEKPALQNIERADVESSEVFSGEKNNSLPLFFRMKYSARRFASRLKAKVMH